MDDMDSFVREALNPFANFLSWRKTWSWE